MKGKITRFFEDKQFGFISVPGQKEDYFFHKADCINFTPDNKSRNMEVEFEDEESSKGPRARLVTA